MSAFPVPAADTTVGSPAVNITIFLLFVLATLAIVVRASRTNRTATDYYAGGRSFTGPQNGIALSGDYLSAASFLGIAGAIAINGYDGFMYSIGFLVAWLVALLLVAELLRNVGRFTLADVLSFRLHERPVRTAAAISTLVVSLFYLLAQMVGAGGLVNLLLGVKGGSGQNLDDRRGRRPHADLRPGRRHEGHHLGADHQGRAPHRGCRDHDAVGARQVRVQPVRPARRHEEAPDGKTVELVTPGLQYGKTDTTKLDFVSLVARPGARHRRPAAHPAALLHRAVARRRRGAACSGRSG